MLKEKDMRCRPFLSLLPVVTACIGLIDPSSAQAQSCRRPACCVCPPPCCLPGESVPATTPEKPGAEPVPAPSSPVTDIAAPASPYEVSDLGGGALSTFDSTVGYIDNPVPGNFLRLRVDAAWGNNRATRAEFFYARGAPFGPGLPLPETNDDFQEIMAYAEGLLTPNLSAFVEVPVRFLNPTVNENHAGFGDLNTGFKWAFLRNANQVTSFQFRVYAPTGDADKGLGTDHASLEPALLCLYRPTDRLRIASELRLWVPVGGTSFSGEIIRYGIGFSYGERPADRWWVVPVIEFVGWTVLSGQEAITPPLPPLVVSAAGDTIVNAKIGLRIGFGQRCDFYSGYGRALTGEVWYKDIWRTEFRLAF
jgi:hypothetical protein